MNLIQDIHDTVINEHGQASDEFLNYLDDEDRRVHNEHKREVQQQDVYNNDYILSPENLSTTGQAVWQWLNDNPGWWKDQ